MNPIFPRSILGAAIAAVLATPGITWAQSADATLRGKAPASTAVTARNVATGATRRTQASADGNYTLAGLPPGTYRVDAGPGTETTVTLTVASTATLDLTASSGAVEAPDAPMQEITVDRPASRWKCEPPKSARRCRNTRSRRCRRSRAISSSSPTPFRASCSRSTAAAARKSAAARRTENGVNLYIDGVGQKGYVRSGVSGQAGDTQGNPFPQLAIGEYKVITSNYKAEYDQISSAAITALSPLGHQRIQGEAFGTYTADNYRARTPARARLRAQRPNRRARNTASLSADRSSQDRLHFFLTYEAKRFVTPMSVLTAFAPDNVARSCLPMRSRSSDPRPSISRKTCSSRSSTGRSPTRQPAVLGKDSR